MNVFQRERWDVNVLSVFCVCVCSVFIGHMFLFKTVLKGRRIIWLASVSPLLYCAAPRAFSFWFIFLIFQSFVSYSFSLSFPPVLRSFIQSASVLFTEDLRSLQYTFVFCCWMDPWPRGQWDVLEVELLKTFGFGTLRLCGTRMSECRTWTLIQTFCFYRHKIHLDEPLIGYRVVIGWGRVCVGEWRGAVQVDAGVEAVGSQPVFSHHPQGKSMEMLWVQRIVGVCTWWRRITNGRRTQKSVWGQEREWKWSRRVRAVSDTDSQSLTWYTVCCRGTQA